MEANTGVSFLFGRSLIIPDSTLAGLLLFVTPCSIDLYTNCYVMHQNACFFIRVTVSFFKRMGCQSANNFVLLCARIDAVDGIVGRFVHYR